MTEATHDRMTGLLNRREFERRLEAACASISDDATHVLCYFDLARFKAVNDRWGHRAGDEALRVVAGLLQTAARDADNLVGRLGGEEFGVFLYDCTLERGRAFAADAVQRIRSQPIVWQAETYTVDVRAGVAGITGRRDGWEDLMIAAMSACSMAGLNDDAVRTYAVSAEDAMHRRDEVACLQKLQRALDEDRFELLTRPIANASTPGHGPGCEVRVRIRDETGAWVSTDAFAFFSAASRHGLMPHIDRWTVSTTLTLLARGAFRDLPADRGFCIQLSIQTLAEPGFLVFVLRTLDRTGVTPSRVCFSIEESGAAMTDDLDLEHARSTIEVLQGQGCEFALDRTESTHPPVGDASSLRFNYIKVDGTLTPVP